MVQPLPATEEDGNSTYHHADSEPSVNVSSYYKYRGDTVKVNKMWQSKS